VKKVGLTQTDAAVDEERVVGAGRRLRDREGGSMREAVRGSDDVGLEGVPRIEKEWLRGGCCRGS
jgi:hypothetical protein